MKLEKNSCLYYLLLQDHSASLHINGGTIGKIPQPAKYNPYTADMCKD
jgi:hypothetical protein